MHYRNFVLNKYGIEGNGKEGKVEGWREGEMNGRELAKGENWEK